MIHGESIRTHPLKCKRQMAYIPDNPNLYEHLTGYQYINFIADIYRVPSEERRKRVSKQVEGIHNMMSRLPPLSRETPERGGSALQDCRV